MRFKNRTAFILTIGGHDHLQPYGISREFSAKEIEANNELQSRLLAKNVEEYTGIAPELPVKRHQDIRYEVDAGEEAKGTPVTVPGKAGRPPVQYIMADAEGNDGVSMDSGDTITSFGKDASKSGDFIESGVNARTFKNGADAAEAEMNQESEAATFDDEESLAENESERSEGLDVDAAISADASEFLHPQGKNGAQVTTVKATVEKEMTSAMAKINQEGSAKLDDGEYVEAAPGKVADFLKKPLNAKKFMIAKETDSGSLKEVNKISASDTVKQLVTQRLEELKH